MLAGCQAARPGRASRSRGRRYRELTATGSPPIGTARSCRYRVRRYRNRCLAGRSPTPETTAPSRRAGRSSRGTAAAAKMAAGCSCRKGSAGRSHCRGSSLRTKSGTRPRGRGCDNTPSNTNCCGTTRMARGACPRTAFREGTRSSLGRLVTVATASTAVQRSTRCSAWFRREDRVGGPRMEPV